MDGAWVGLADTVRGVRAELRAAMAEGADEDLRFEVGPVELEFAVDVRREEGHNAGVKVYVASFGATGAAAATSSHRMRLTLHPKDERGDPARVGTTAPAIPER